MVSRMTLYPKRGYTQLHPWSKPAGLYKNMHRGLLEAQTRVWGE